MDKLQNSTTCDGFLVRSYTKTKSPIVSNNFLSPSLISTPSFGYTKPGRYEMCYKVYITERLLKYQCKQSLRKITLLMIQKSTSSKYWIHNIWIFGWIGITKNSLINFIQWSKLTETLKWKELRSQKISILQKFSI